MNPRPSLAARPIVGHLATFIAVAETRSFRRAAEMVGRSQPAVTAQVRQLEALLGVALFTRTTRQVQPTAAGAELLERAKRIVGETDRLIRDFQGQASLTSGRVAISVSPTVATGLIARFLVLFEQEFPSITVSVREDLGAAMFEALETADVELGIGPYAEAPERLSFRPLFEQPFFLIVAADHPLARRGHARLADLAGLALLCPARGTTARAVIDDAARAAGLALQPKYEATQHDTLVSMAAAGLGATVMPAGDRRVLAALGVAAVPFEDARLSRKVGVLSRRHEPLTAPAAAFLRLLLLVATGGIAVGDTGLRPIVADAPAI